MTRLLETLAPARLGAGFRWLLGSSWASNLGDGIVLAAGPLLVASETRDPRLIALATLVQWAPAFLFGLYAGALADRLDRRTLVVVGMLVRTAVLVVLVTMIATGRLDIGLLLVLLFALGSIETFVDSAHRTVLPMLVGPADLGLANSRTQFGWMGINRLVAPPIGGALFAAGALWPFLAQVVCALFALVLFSRIVLPPLPTRTGEPTHVLRDIAEGVRWSVRHPAMRALNLQILTFNVTYGASWSVLVLYADERLGVSDVGYGLLLAASAVGGVVGALTYAPLERRVPIREIMRWGLVLETLTHAALAWTTTPAVAAGVLLLFGVHESYWGTTASSVRQRAVPPQLQGRVASVYVMCMTGGLVLGSAVGGLIAGEWGITAPYWCGFVGSGLILAAMWREIGRIAHADDEIRLADAGRDASQQVG